MIFEGYSLVFLIDFLVNTKGIPWLYISMAILKVKQDLDVTSSGISKDPSTCFEINNPGEVHAMDIALFLDQFVI